jgi:hypothetical protein
LRKPRDLIDELDGSTKRRVDPDSGRQRVAHHPDEFFIRKPIKDALTEPPPIVVPADQTRGCSLQLSRQVDTE